MSPKRLEDVMRLENNHIIIDCCPRKGDRTVPVDSANCLVNISEEYEKDDLFEGKRAKYTFYMNIGIVLGMVARNEELVVTCPICHERYNIQHKKIREIYKDHLEFLFPGRFEES
ncbi:hypothetical protein J4438_02225 [Candidatus Woesearchaeota archaeon]|nr:hypothetical protein [Candidatus Woesearchaeota archaeon]